MRTLLFLSAALLPMSAHAGPLTYQAAIDLAERSAPGLEAKALQIEANRAAARAAGALPDPKLSVGVDNYPVSGPSAGRFDAEAMTMARIGIMQEVPNAARRRAAAAAARADVGIAEAHAAIEAREVRTQAALAWIDLAYAERRLAMLDQLTDGLKDLWAGQPSSIASGEARPATSMEPVRLRARFEDLRSELVAEAAKARAELARWTGEPAPSAVGEAPALAIEPAGLRAAVERLPTLAAYQAAARRAEAEVAAARAAKRPDWAFEVSYGRRDPMFGDMVSAGVTVSLPLFASRRQDPLIAARSAEASRVRAEREAARREIVAALEADLAAHVAHHDQWRRAREVLVSAAEQRADLETASYAAGRADFGAVMEALTSLAETKLEALEREAMVARDGARIVLTYGADQ